MKETTKQKVKREMEADVGIIGSTDILHYCLKYDLPQDKVEKWAREIGLGWQPPVED